MAFRDGRGTRASRSGPRERARASNARCDSQRCSRGNAIDGQASDSAPPSMARHGARPGLSFAARLPAWPAFAALGLGAVRNFVPPYEFHALGTAPSPRSPALATSQRLVGFPLPSWQQATPAARLMYRPRPRLTYAAKLQDPARPARDHLCLALSTHLDSRDQHSSRRRT